MRIMLALVLVLSVAACGKKKSPQAPATQSEAAPAETSADDEKDVTAPADSDDAMRSSDPEEGGE